MRGGTGGGGGRLAGAGGKGAARSDHREEEVLGKAYDGRLMRRLLQYLLPYRSTVIVASAAMICHSMLQVVGPFLTKVAVDRYLVVTTHEPTFLDSYLSSDPFVGVSQITALYLLVLVLLFANMICETRYTAT